MRIEELVLEGFKSYPVRTQITGWDSSFNAITGLNGSGKSNILDAICFVLGITNMSQMRAANQQDLIYKRGQAGITKASVTIVFDNSDREKSPLGLENCKQITVTRQIALPNISKYLLNGHKSQQATIQTLFQSVQLNINNPNFLIMQGRITKVLNMRPPEILSLVEEAAGTRMFEERKSKALKTMAKKEKRVSEITSLLEEEITPKLDALRAEKKNFLQFQKASTELERIGRILRAWEWSEGHERIERKTREIAANDKEKQKVAKDQKQCSKEIKAAEKSVEDVTRKRDEEMRKGGKFKKSEEEVAELEKVLVKIRTQVDIKNGSIREEEDKVIGLEGQLKELVGTFEAKRHQLEELSVSYAQVMEKHSASQAALTTSEELLQTLLTGLSSDSAGKSGGGYMGQLADARARLAAASTEEEQTRVKLGMSEKELKTLQAKWKTVEKEAGEGQKKVERMKGEVEALRVKTEKLGWNEEKERTWEETVKRLRDDIRRFTEQRDAIRQRLSSLDFEYASPSANFDHSKVKGLVARLIQLRAEDYDKSTALEITAGAKLYNVVVQDERVGKDLLTNGRLKKRITIIPLSKINSHTMSNQKLDAVNRAAPGKVNLALDLVGYPEDVAPAMAFVFGDTIIAADADAAKAVTFGVGARSVTLAGDVYDPSGTLSGGSAPSSSGILVRAQELIGAETKLREAQVTMDEMRRKEEAERSIRDTWRNGKRELEIKMHELRLFQEQIGGSNASRVGADIEALQKQIDDLKATQQKAKEKQATAEAECKKLQKDMDEFKNNKDGKIDELKADIAQRKAALQKQSIGVKTQQKEVQTATLELAQMESDIEKAKETIIEAQDAVDKLKKELGKQQDQLVSSEEAHARATAKLAEERATLTRFDTELASLQNVIREKKQAVADADLALKKLEHDAGVLVKDRTTAENFVANLEKIHDWILEEKDQFGKPNSAFDFSKMDVAGLKDKATELETQQTGMKKKINPKVINMTDSVEKREMALTKMLSTVLKDKEKIEQTIEELDRYKRDALQKTWEKVNRDFGGIFAELLPGNFAKLQPPEGQDLMQGLEVKVQLGTVWKQSLTELSGGQRSLIALSLIMALLQFKPAPMYILDEIDAALDLSHTQHIGQLFRTRFRGSQFIVVSLKEGLFTNANVLFRTRFRDGTSVVERTTQRSNSALYAGNNGRDKDDNDNPLVTRARRIAVA